MSGITRRRLLGTAAGATAAGAFGAGYLVGGAGDSHTAQAASASVPFHGEHQAGIATAAQDRLVFAATEEGIPAIWRTPLFGMSAQRLYAVSVSAGEPASLHDLERDGSLRVIA